MNIGFYRYSVYNRGGDRLIIEYANYLASVGHEVTLYARDINTIFVINQKVRIQRIPYPTRVGCLIYGATHRLNHEVVIVDIIHLPLLLSLHNYVVYYAQADDREYYESRLIKKIIDLLYERHFHRGNPIISMSRHLTDIFNKKYKRVDAYTIKTGIDHATFYPEPDSELVNDKGKKKAIVFMVRGDAYRKGYDIALKTFESLDKSITDRIELWVCGQQQEGSIFPFIVKNFGIVSDSRLRQILSSADIFFYPSRHEGFGLFPLEAMACGCIVVTTEAIPYAKETPSIVTSKIGDCRDLARNISTLILDEVLLHNLQEQAINESKKYDLMRSKKEFEFVLAEILQEQRQ